jgi:hypothetical protein
VPRLSNSKRSSTITASYGIVRPPRSPTSDWRAPMRLNPESIRGLQPTLPVRALASPTTNSWHCGKMPIPTSRYLNKPRLNTQSSNRDRRTTRSAEVRRALPSRLRTTTSLNPAFDAGECLDETQTLREFTLPAPQPASGKGRGAQSPVSKPA